MESSMLQPKSTKKDGLLLKETSNRTEVNSLDKFSQEVMGSAAKKFNSAEAYVENLYDYMSAIIYNMPGYVYWKDTNGIYLGCNAGMLEVLGLSSEKEILGKTDSDMAKLHNWPESSIASIRAIDEQVIQSKQPIVNVEEGPFKTKNNPALYQLSTKTPLFDKEGNVAGVLSTSTDITGLKQGRTIASSQLDLNFLDKLNRKVMGSGAKKYDSVQEYVENLYLYLDTIIYNMPGSVYWKDANGVYLGCNAGALDIVNLSSKDQLVGKTNHDFARLQGWPEGLADSIDAAEKQIIKTKKPVENIQDGPFKTKYSPAVYQLTNKVPLFDQNHNVIGILGVSIDITELKKAQEREKIALAEATESKALAQAQEEIQTAVLTFTGTMSHDLRTPLSTIKLIVSLVSKILPNLLQVYQKYKNSDEDIPYISPKQINTLEEACHIIDEAVKEANSYIDITLKMVKGAAAGSELLKPEDLVSCSMEEIIRRVVETFPYENKEGGLVHFDTLHSFHFMGNAIFMSRILQNLIKNSLEQIKLKGKGEIFIKSELGEPFNYLKIKDTAGGVSSSVIERIFTGFNSTKVGGTGLGLSSAKQVMDVFGGDISCHLVEGDCVEFVLSFPKIVN